MKKSQKMRENKNEKVHEMLDQVQLSLLEQQLLNLLLDGLNLRLDLGTLVLSHAEMQWEVKIFFLVMQIFIVPYLAAMTGLLTPQARPSACLDLTNT